MYVRLGTSLTRTERKAIERRFGRSHAVRIANSPRPYESTVCDCHGLHWPAGAVDTLARTMGHKVTCPLSD